MRKIKTINVLLKKEELASTSLAGHICVVFDVLFATTTIITALAHGAREVWPALHQDEAIALAKRLPSPWRLAGECNGALIEGFDSPLPIALSHHLRPDESLIYATTNGTLALRWAQGADAVYAAAILNIEATANYIRQHHANDDLILVCAGSMDRFNLEDFRGVAELIHALGPHHYHLSDSAMAALALREAMPIDTALHQGSVGRLMAAHQAQNETTYATQLNHVNVVAKLDSDAAVRKIL